jgi:hypothetical protein
MTNWTDVVYDCAADTRPAGTLATCECRSVCRPAWGRPALVAATLRARRAFRGSSGSPVSVVQTKPVSCQSDRPVVPRPGRRVGRGTAAQRVRRSGRIARTSPSSARSPAGAPGRGRAFRAPAAGHCPGRRPTTAGSAPHRVAGRCAPAARTAERSGCPGPRAGARPPRRASGGGASSAITRGRRTTAAGLDASAPSRTAVSSTARRIV